MPSSSQCQRFKCQMVSRPKRSYRPSGVARSTSSLNVKIEQRRPALTSLATHWLPVLFSRWLPPAVTSIRSPITGRMSETSKVEPIRPHAAAANTLENTTASRCGGPLTSRSTARESKKENLNSADQITYQSEKIIQVGKFANLAKKGTNCFDTRLLNVKGSF